MSYRHGYEKSAHLYDLFDKKENIEFFYQYTKDAGEILDIGAGTGRIAIPLAKRGIKVFCVEPSPAMRREFLKKLSCNPEIEGNIILVDNDASTFNFRRPFPAAFLSGSFDHFINDDERLLSLLNINKHLNPNGILVFDVFLGLMKDTPLSLAGILKKGNKEFRRLVGGKLMPDKKKVTILVFDEYESGKLINRIEEHSIVGVINREKLHLLLTETGFEVKKEFSNYDFTEYSEGDELLVVEAIKLSQ